MHLSWNKPVFCGIIRNTAEFNRLIRQAWNTEDLFLPGFPRLQGKTDNSERRIVCICFMKKTQDWFKGIGNKVQYTCMLFTEDLCTIHVVQNVYFYIKLLAHFLFCIQHILFYLIKKNNIEWSLPLKTVN